MEDAHAAILDLDGENTDSSAFFAVYDGHGGTYILLIGFVFSLICSLLGSNVAKYAGQNVHKRLVLEDAYKEKVYEAALKKAFLGVDEDLQASTPEIIHSPPTPHFFNSIFFHKTLPIQRTHLVAQPLLLW